VTALTAEGLTVRKELALAHGPVEALATRLAAEAEALAPGHATVVAGEPTVLVRGDGRGGRAQHAALLLAEPLRVLGDRVALALASDGSDGPTDAAGAIVHSETWDGRLDLGAAIAAHDSHTVLGGLGALVRTGPTGTNLTDLYVVARAP
jgi:glycerate 2-kinase